MTPPHFLLVREDVPCAAQPHTALSSLWEARKTGQNIKKPVEVRGRSAGHSSWFGFLTLQDISGEKKLGDASPFLRAVESVQLGCRGVLCVGGWVRRDRDSGAARILQITWDPTVAGAKLLQFLGVMERKSLFSCADGDILGSVSHGEPPMVAGGESKPGEKILACKGVRKKPTACFDVVSSKLSNSPHVNRWFASC